MNLSCGINATITNATIINERLEEQIHINITIDAYILPHNIFIFHKKKQLFHCCCCFDSPGSSNIFSSLTPATLFQNCIQSKFNLKRVRFKYTHIFSISLQTVKGCKYFEPLCMLTENQLSNTIFPLAKRHVISKYRFN